MADALMRGDRQVVADPESAALQTYFATGDVILNPFDARCARWDLLAEIERPSDFAFLSSSLLPHLGQADHDQRSEERRVGKGGVGPSRSWWSPCHKQKNHENSY